MNPNRFAVRTLPVLMVTALAGAAPLAFGQQALEEVIVTAQKTAENLQDVPISVRSLDSMALEKSGVVVLTDIQASLPGLDLAPYPGSNETLYPSIRSIQANSVSVATPIPMAVHINGVYVSQISGLNTAGADLERIELLKGPQGVLSGRNATGGALNLYTLKPTLGEFQFKQQITVAERGQILAKTNVNIPLTENLAARISYLNSRKDNDGIRNSAPGGIQFGQKDSEAWRLDLRWRPSEQVTVDYGYDLSDSHSYDTPSQCLAPANQTWYGGFLGMFAADPRVAAYMAGCSTQKLTSLYYPFALPKNHNKIEGHTLTVEWVPSTHLTVRSITGYRKVDARNNVIYSAYAGDATFRADNGPFSILPVGSTPFNGQATQFNLYNETWSQELQFIGKVNENFKYTTGIYYSQDKGSQNQGPGLTAYVADGGAIIGPVFEAAYGIPGLAATVANSDLAVASNRGITRAVNTSLGLYGQISWRPDILSRKLEIVPGVRYSRDHRQATGYNLNGMYFVDPTTNTLTAGLPGGFASATGDRTFSNTSPQISFNYHWTDDMMSYVKIAKAYTTGGFDIMSSDPVAFSKGFAPETLTSYEIGFKGEFLDHRLRTNIDVFQSNYFNQQQSVATPTATGPVWIIQNVGQSRYDGIEMDLAFAATERLRLNMDAAWLRFRFNHFADLTSGLDVASTRRQLTPKLAYNLSANYRFPDFGLPGKLDGTLSFSYRGPSSTAYDTTVPNAAFSNITPSINIVNGRLALSQIRVGPGGNGDLTVALWGKNLADKKYQTFRYQAPMADAAASWGEPRTFGIDMIYRY
ncbi:MAG: TonB-dependent receptor [Proteobacteria bacterium]|nr:TonB-dependent receptor [Pseudomonadota bacterium]HQR04642.1 TonB-dependent receptor [Rhodocyclaceae bacterium]